MNYNIQMESYIQTQQSYVSGRDDNTESRMLSSRFLMDLGELIPTDWEKLGIELEVSPEKMRELRSNCTTDVSSWAMDMLYKWTELYEDNIQLVHLYEGLEKVRRNDLIQVVKDTFDGASELQSCTPDLQKVFHKLSSKLSTEWYDLGIQLEIPSDALDTIKTKSTPAMDLKPAYEMLKFWNREHTCPHQLEELKRSLRECRRNDVVRWIEERQGQDVFARPQSTSRRSVGQELSGNFASMQVSNNSDITYQRPVPQEGYDEIDNVGRTHNEHDENDRGCCSSTSSHLTNDTLVQLDSLNDNGNKVIDLPGGLNASIPKTLTAKTSADSINDEYSVYADSTTSC